VLSCDAARGRRPLCGVFQCSSSVHWYLAPF
jgi:hypothetical protein